MKKKELDDNLEYIIIDGLIKEAEQDGADFAAAMRLMSDEEFEDMVMEPMGAFHNNNNMECKSVSPIYNRYSMLPPSQDEEDYDDYGQIETVASTSAEVVKPEASRRWRPWILAGVCAVAVILTAIISGINIMNGRLCDSALYMSEMYVTTDVRALTKEQIKEELPALEGRFESAPAGSEESVSAGWELTVAYLKLHRKGDAVRVLGILQSETEGSPMGDQCAALLKLLD